MNLEQTYFFAEILAAMAVVASLIYLGIQIRQNRIQNQKENINLLTQKRSDFIKVLSTDKEFSLLAAKGLAGTSKMDDNDYFRFTCYLFSVFVDMESGFRKWRNKDIDQDTWEAWHKASIWWFTSPGVQAWWKNDLVKGFTQEFCKYVDSSIEAVNGSPNYQEQMVSFLAKASENIEPKKNTTKKLS